jgi:hypothetical protein
MILIKIQVRWPVNFRKAAPVPARIVHASSETADVA